MRSDSTAPEREERRPDCLTVIAMAVIAYAWLIMSHEGGHCAVAAVLDNRCTMLSTTYFTFVYPPPLWKYNIIVVAGSSANWASALVCLGLLRGWRTASNGLRYFLWLLMSVSLFLPATYTLAAAIIKYGDSYALIYTLRYQLIWRIVAVLLGAVLCWLSFRLSRAELIKLIGGGGREARSIAWALVAPAYVAGGIVIVAAALFSQLPAKWAQLQAVGGTFGLTVWLLLLPLVMPKEPTSTDRLFILSRSVGWIVVGGLTALILIGVLGRGVSL